jgi:glucokinase
MRYPFMTSLKIDGAESGNRPLRAAGEDTPVLGIDVGGTKILGGIVTRNGQVLFQHRAPTPRDRLLDGVVAMAEAVAEEAVRMGLAATAVGIGTTGFVDRARGTLVQSINLGVKEIEIASAVAKATGLSVVVDNDVHAATLGELYFGAGRTYADFIFYNAGTGVATGMVVGGRLYRGASNAAGENGHISSDQSGRTLSSTGMSGDIEQLLLDSRAGKDTVPAYLPHIEPPPQREYGYLALNLVQLVNLMNPAAIILGGGMFTNDDAATEWVKRAVYAHALPISLRGLAEISLCRTAHLAGLIGAASLVIEREALSEEQDLVLP